jgi:uncharacterized membrane protein
VNNNKLSTIPVLVGGLVLAIFGVLSVVSRDFAFQWQPVPAGFPARVHLAVLVGAIEAAAGICVLIQQMRSKALIAAAFIYLGWALLHIPVIIATPNVASFLGVAEPAALFLGFSIATGRAQASATRSYGFMLVVFGISHFVYADFTASFIPDWMPGRLYLAYFTGIAHASAGIALLFNIVPRLAAWLECAMMLSFVALVHIPRVLAHPHDRLEWTMLLVAVALSASAAQVAVSMKKR